MLDSLQDKEAASGSSDSITYFNCQKIFRIRALWSEIFRQKEKLFHLFLNWMKLCDEFNFRGSQPTLTRSAREMGHT